MHETSQSSLLADGVLLLGFELAFVLAFRRAGLGTANPVRAPLIMAVGQTAQE